MSVKGLTVAMLAGLVFAGTAAAENLRWQANYGDALAATKQAKKPLLVILYEPGKNEEVVRPVSDSKSSADSLLANYELCKIDVTSDYGQRTAKSFKAASFPHTAVIDKTGSYILYDKAGQFSSSEWTTMLTKYRTGEVTPVSATSSSNASWNEFNSRRSFGGGGCPSCRRF